MPSSNERSNGTSMTMPWAGLGQLMIGVNHGNVPHGATVAVDFGNVASTARADGRQYHVGLTGALKAWQQHGSFLFQCEEACRIHRVERSSSGGIYMSYNRGEIVFNAKVGSAKIGGKSFEVGRA